jgi:hypothetical protein
MRTGQLAQQAPGVGFGRCGQAGGGGHADAGAGMQAQQPEHPRGRRTRAAGWLLKEALTSVITGVAPVLVVLVVLAAVAPPDGAITAALLVFGLILGVSVARFARRAC